MSQGDITIVEAILTINLQELPCRTSSVSVGQKLNNILQ